MRPLVRSPLRTLIALLLVAVVMGAGFCIFDYVNVYRPKGELSYLPIAYDGPPPNGEELADAMAIVREAGWIREIAGDQKWTLLDHEWLIQWTSLPNANKLGIRFTVVWEQPVESDGPWHIGRCKLTRVTKSFATFTNVRTVQVVVDMDRRVPLTRSTDAPFDEDLENPVYVGPPAGKKTVAVSDAITSKVLYEGPRSRVPRRLKRCPPELDNEYRD